MEDFQKMVVLIDADNTQLSRLEEVLHEISTYGRIIVKKAYGNFTKPNLHKWEDKIKSLAIKAEQQFDYVAGKNTTDIAMVIDAMDLLHTGMYDAAVLVSSDSDFTPLAVRLKESGMYVIGVGEKKTPEAFCNACDDFIYLEYLTSTKSKEQVQNQTAKAQETKKSAKDGGEEKTARKTKSKAASSSSASSSKDGKDSDIGEIHALLRIAYEKFVEDDDGYVNISSAGVYIKRVKPEFSPLAYGYNKLSDLIKDFPQLYEIKRDGDRKTSGYSYRCMGRA